MSQTPTPSLLDRATRHLFFTGKGGVGKTSVACAVALALADAGRTVLLVSTDPASNLDEMLGVRLGDRVNDRAGATADAEVSRVEHDTPDGGCGEERSRQPVGDRHAQ